MIRSFVAGALFLGTMVPVYAAEPQSIGKAVAVQRVVSVMQDDESRRLKKGDAVFLNEAIETGKKARGEFIFNDNTKLAVGPNSRIVLDKFVYNADKKNSEIVINATKGAFRFISGKSGSAAYTIKTPSASIGVRGTIFDVYIADDGEVAILLIEGGVDVCGYDRSCRSLSRVGYFLHVTAAGIVSDVLRWDGSFFSNIAIATAFPFVGRRLIIDPVRRLRHTGLYGGRLLRRGLRTPERAIRRVVPRRIRRPRLPRF